MKNNNNKYNNVINFDNWKHVYTDSQKEINFCEYLSVLDFGELISESNEIIKELKNNNLDRDLTFRSKLILKEFDKRISSNRQSDKHFTTNFCKNTEEKIISIEKILQ